MAVSVSVIFQIRAGSEVDSGLARAGLLAIRGCDTDVCFCYHETHEKLYFWKLILFTVGQANGATRPFYRSSWKRMPAARALG
ncbi:hypothetical protein Enr17x_26880 [Gimesia fumaroli]|uniref:Uncharacterized protein n=1 Tax=Gimesia fumaroli TaxID=2527976 RepID=A0A518IC20_9PLAN|nr:hypothetical protein Enr17x_26880 [Gimesia fumaroli]